MIIAGCEDKDVPEFGRSSQASSPRTLPSSRSTNGAASGLWGHVNAWVNATVAGVTSNGWSVEAESWASDLPAKLARRRI